MATQTFSSYHYLLTVDFLTKTAPSTASGEFSYNRSAIVRSISVQSFIVQAVNVQSCNVHRCYFVPRCPILHYFSQPSITTEPFALKLPSVHAPSGQRSSLSMGLQWVYAVCASLNTFKQKRKGISTGVEEHHPLTLWLFCDFFAAMHVSIPN